VSGDLQNETQGVERVNGWAEILHRLGELGLRARPVLVLSHNPHARNHINQNKTENPFTQFDLQNLTQRSPTGANGR
jgi:hypothetical protein